ncbi:MAG: AAA family ATPase [Anaerolineales bacterium]|nr:AAA family ATPase [Anaerolineales bacterium]
MNQHNQRFSVVGTTGSGKTTVAREIAACLQIPHIELDALFWEEDWTGVPEETFRERISSAIAAETWVSDGNYSRVRDLVWARADTVVFLDYPFCRVFLQLLSRTFRRGLKKEVLWADNRETMRKAFFSRDSILLYMLRTYWRNRKKYPALFSQTEYTHLKVVHLQTPRETEDWLSGLSKAENGTYLSGSK